ncbi:MerR family transcriptional regulator [Verrucomicrobium spinosum]|uniref:MerR family transcriptional regulator n=1 Tax=Verrucomicrobium spinosum TaxID=2736 RepID=UPI0009462CA0|nr:MerR family transcriptional regulator [Verrucomicrobium spinosum]
MVAASKELRHPIKVVCHRTGLTAHAIRVWERRYGLICCKRTDSNRRLYSDEEIERLRLLKELTDCGHRISQISCLCLDELYGLYKKEVNPAPVTAPLPQDLSHDSAEQCLQRCKEAVQVLDTAVISDLLEEARLRYGQRTVLLRIIAPLVHEVGEAWRRGEMRVSHEHLATSVVRDFLALGARNYQLRPNAPELLVTTPIGQIHEVGASWPPPPPGTSAGASPIWAPLCRQKKSPPVCRSARPARSPSAWCTPRTIPTSPMS